MQRFGMQNLGAEIGEVGGFEIGNFGNRACVGNELWIAREDAVDISPDDDFIGVDGSAENRGGIIGTSARLRGSRRDSR